MGEPETTEEIRSQNANKQVGVPSFGDNPVDTIPSKTADTTQVVAQSPSVQMLGGARFEDRGFPERHFIPFETKTALKKLLGILYFFLGGITVFLSFYLPETMLRDMALRYVIPTILGMVSIIMIIHGYFMLTEDNRDHN